MFIPVLSSSAYWVGVLWNQTYEKSSQETPKASPQYTSSRVSVRLTLSLHYHTAYPYTQPINIFLKIDKSELDHSKLILGLTPT